MQKDKGKPYKKTLGALGEALASDYLAQNNFKIIDKNFRYKRYGEIDIIAIEDEYIAFIEVKTRSNNDYGAPSESVTKSKQKSIINLSQIYMDLKQIKDLNPRFDIVEVIIPSKKSENTKHTINLIKNAFSF